MLHDDHRRRRRPRSEHRRPGPGRDARPRNQRQGLRSKRRIAGLVGVVAVAGLAMSLTAWTTRSTDAAPGPSGGPSRVASTEARASTSPAATAGSGATGWAGCPQPADPTLECADLLAPTGTLTVARAPATGDAGRVLLLVPPQGDDGVTLLSDWIAALDPAVRATFDVVSFDRGVPGAAGQACAPDPGRSLESPTSLTNADIEAAAQERADRARALAAKCLQQGREALETYGSVAAARDLDRIRRGLGVDQLDILALGEGTRLATTYARLFPGGVHSMTLDGTVGPQENQLLLASARPALDDQALATLERVCAKDPDCPVTGGIAAAWDAIVEAAGQGRLPVAAPDTPLDAATAVAGMRVGLESAQRWRQLLAAMAAAAAGDGSGIAALALLRTGEPSGAADARTTSWLAHRCADLPDRPDVADVTAAARASNRGHPRFGATDVLAALDCTGWPVPPEPVIPVALMDGPPTLIVRSREDPAAPVQWALFMREAIADSAFVTYAGSGHTVYGVSTCVTQRVDEFLLSGTQPAATDCPVTTGDGVSMLEASLVGALTRQLADEGLGGATSRCVATALAASLTVPQQQQALTGTPFAELAEQVEAVSRSCASNVP